MSGALRYVYPATTRDAIVAALESNRAALRFASERAYQRRDLIAGARYDSEVVIANAALDAIDKAENGAVA